MDRETLIDMKIEITYAKCTMSNPSLQRLVEWNSAIPSNNIKGAPQLRSRADALALRARGMDLHDRLGVRLHPAMSVARLQRARGATEDGHRVQGAPMITDWLTGWPCNTLLHKSTSGSCIWKNNRNFVTTSTYHDIHNLSANSSPNQTLNSWNCHHRHGTFAIYCFLFWDPIRVPSPNWHHVLIKFQQQNSNRSSTNVLFCFPNVLVTSSIPGWQQLLAMQSFDKES